MTEQNKPKEWYSNQQLYEMMQELGKEITIQMQGLQKDLSETSKELEKTQVMIREYNGLRSRLDKCENQIAENLGKGAGSLAMWGYIVGGMGVLLTIINFAVR